jgi:hypothetical protein
VDLVGNAIKPYPVERRLKAEGSTSRFKAEGSSLKPET